MAHLKDTTITGTLDVSGDLSANNLSGTNTGDEVFEYADLASFPATGEASKIYTALDTNYLYRWDGVSAYVRIGNELDYFEEAQDSTTNQWKAKGTGTDYDIELVPKGTGIVKTTTEMEVGGTDTGQSVIDRGLIVNNSGDGSDATYDFVVKTANLDTAFVVDASADTIDISARVNISNILKLTPRSAPSSGEEGDIYYDSTANKLKFCTVAGTPGTWETITSA